MALGLDREKLLYAVGIVLGIVAVGYFGFQLFDQVSPVTTALLLAAGFVCFLVGGIVIDVDLVDVVAYALAAGCYLVFVAYVLSRFDVGDAGTFLLLAVSSGLFIGLGYLAQRDRLTMSRRSGAIVVLAVLIASLALVGADLVGAQATTTTEIESAIEIPDERGTVTVGTVTVENDFPLPREADVPMFFACVYGPDFRPAPLEYEPQRRSGLLQGGESRRHELVLPGRAFYTENGTRRPGFRDLESVPVERGTDCAETDQDPKVVVVTNPIRR